MRKPSLRERLAHWLAPKPAPRPGQKRMYAGARMTNTTLGLGAGGSSSADTELSGSLERLRNRSRQMVRDSAYAKRASMLVVNNVIGAGMGVQAQVMGTRGELRNDINNAIEAEWAAWSVADRCHTGGVLHFSDLERAAMAQVFDTGECFIRVHEQRFGSSTVPLALELIEAERIMDGLAGPVGGAGPGAEIRLGVEVDTRFGRPLAYWVRTRHPGDIRPAPSGDQAERVPASQMYHLSVRTRWPQTRGEPWLHAVVRKLDDMNEYTQLEVTAARGSAAYFATITTPEEQNPLLDPPTNDDDAPTMALDPLTVQQLNPGEELQFHTPNRPNAALDPFMRHMLREVASGAGPSYESLSRDYSQSNYSSSRLALLDDRDLWRVLQQWWIRAFRLPLHKRWLQQAVLSRAVEIPIAQYAADMAKFEAVRFKPRGWSWVDPTKEVNAYKEAIKAGLTTISDVIAATGEGRDIEDFIATRQRELDLLAAAGILVDTTVMPKPKPGAPAPASDDDETLADDDEPKSGSAPAGRVLPIRKATSS